LEAPADLVVAQVAVSEVRAADLVVRAALEVRAVQVFITHHLLHHQDIITAVAVVAEWHPAEAVVVAATPWAEAVAVPAEHSVPVTQAEVQQEVQEEVTVVRVQAETL
jgi:hypothetical protein